MNNFFRLSAVLVGPGTAMVLIFASMEVFFHAKISGHIDWTWLTILCITWLFLLFAGAVLYRAGKRKL